VFSRQVEALGRPGDVLVAISTSGNSENIIQAVTVAKERGITTIGFTGRDGGTLAQLVDIALIVPSQNTARIQEAHEFIMHVLCELIDQKNIAS
jgi:D-sedoheptulose 7-phosphate isomerase